MPFHQFRYIYEVMRCRSINQAAQNLFISPQALRSAVGSMENKIGFKIFERSKRGVTLTPEGEAVEADINAIMEIAEHWTAIRDDLSQVDGVVRLITSTSMCSTVVPSIMVKCQERYPGIQLRHYEARDDGLLEQMAKLRMIGIVAAAPDAELDKYERFAEENHYILEPLRVDAFYVYVNVKNPLSKQGELSLNDLSQLTPVIYPNEDRRASFRGVFKHFAPGHPLYLTHQETIFQLVAETPNFACIFPAAAGENNRFVLEGKLCPMTVREYPMPAFACMILPRPRDLKASEKALINLIREEMRDEAHCAL